MHKKKVSKVEKTKVGKGKKDGKNESKADKESDIEKAKANAALWELRLQVSDQSLVQYREGYHKLARANEELTNQLYRLEKSSMETTAYLEKENAAKEQKINELQRILHSQIAVSEERSKLVEDYKQQKDEMQKLLRKKSRDFNVIQDEIKEFLKTKALMEQELSDFKDCMETAENEHRDNLSRMEEKFFNQKINLEKEAEQKVALEVEKAHNEAILQLDNFSLPVFKENVRLKEALKYHIEQAEDLKKQMSSLVQKNASLTQDKDISDLMIKKNAAQMKAQKEMLSELKTKCVLLEQHKEPKVVEVEGENTDVEKLEKVLAMRERELVHIRRLAGVIVAQRTELEDFFYEALAQVKQEITASRSQYKKEAQQAFHKTMREATAGKIRFPPIRTFNKNPHSTNSVYSDMEAAARWNHQPGNKVHMSDLTWEQKERVLSLLFAKMNGQKECGKGSPPLALTNSSDEKTLADNDAAE
ncbi:uncharacterized protein V6R79_019255 [Siganus canaliculatus]